MSFLHRSWIALIVVAVIASPGRAQSPRAGGPVPGDGRERRIAVELAVTGSLARGFVNRDMITARGIVQGWSGPWAAFLQPYWAFGRVGTPTGRITTDNELNLRAGVYRTISGPAFVYALNRYDRSVRRKIGHRDLFGGGGGLSFERGALSLLTSAGVLGEVTDFDDGQNASPALEDGTLAVGARFRPRWSARVHARYTWKRALAIVHDLIVIPSFRDPLGDYRIIFYGAIDAPIGSGFSARIQADATREGVIVAGTKHGDLVVTFGLSYRGEWAPVPHD